MSEQVVDSARIEALLRAKANATQLYSAEEVQTAIAAMAAQLSADYAALDAIFIVVMNGGLMVGGQLLPLLDFPLEVDYCHATRYRGETRGADIEWRARPQSDLSGRHVVVIDDILDEGHTLLALLDSFHAAGAASVKTAVLVDKRHDRKAVPDMKPDYCALEAPDEYLFGFGMDYRHYWRNTDGIFYINE